MTNDKEVIQLVNGCKDGDDIQFYVDNTVDPSIKPVVQMQPHVVIRPRQNLIQGSVKKPSPKKPVCGKKPLKRIYVTRQDLQNHKNKKTTNKSPGIVKRNSPSAIRKLDLQEDDTSGIECNGEDDSSTKLAPPPPLTSYEKGRIAQMQENDKKLEEFGIKRRPRKREVKDKEKESDDFIPENEVEVDSYDTTEKIKKVKKKNLLGPRTRSRANAITATEKEAAQAGTTIEKHVTSSNRAKELKPTCSKMIKQSSKSKACGSVSAYLALRERQKKGIPAPPTTENLPNLENIAEEETQPEVPAPKRWRGRTKMTIVHARTRAERPVIFLNKRGQPVSKNKKLLRELSNFLGTVAKDNVSLTYVNWHLVPKDLKETMWEYTKDRYIIPDEGLRWVDKTLSNLWRVYKSRMKTRYYTKYNTDEDRMANRPSVIPLEDFKVLVKYWGDEEVQKKSDPKLASPSDAQVYFDSRGREEGRTYKTNTTEVQKRIREIKKKIASGEDADELIANGKTNGREWLKGRLGKSVGSASTATPADDEPYLADLTAKIRRDLEAELESKVNRKVRDNMSVLPKRLGEANPSLNLDIGDFSTTISSEDDENGTPFTAGTSS